MKLIRIRLMALVLAALAVPAVTALATSPAQAATGDAMVSVFHGIPGATVDVYVNDKLTLQSFKPGTLAGPLSLPAGTYSVKVTAPGDEAKIIIGPANVSVTAGMNYTIVAYLGTDGKPTAKPFVNDISLTKAGQGRVTVRHVANAPAVKVTADGATLVPSLSNGNDAVANVPAQTYKVGVAAASGGADVYTTELPVKDGVNTIVYAYGDLAAKTFAVGVQSISGLQSMPAGIPAGSAGLADDASGFPVWAIALVALGLLGAAALTYRLRTAARAE